VPNPIFNLTPAATVDEGNNWVNMSWGPLSLTNPTVVGGIYRNYGAGPMLGNFGIMTGSSAAAKVTGPGPNFTDAPPYDFFNNPRKTGITTDAGAISMGGAGGSTEFTVSPSLLDFGVQGVRTTSAEQDVLVTNSGTAPVTISVSLPGAAFDQTNNCGTLAPLGGNCTINITFVSSGSAGAKSGTLSVTGNGITQTVALTGITTVATVSFSAPTQLFTTPATTTTKSDTITVKNTATGANAGSLTLTAAPIVTRYMGLGTFSITGGTCASGTVLAPAGTPAGTCTIIVQYIPSGTAPSLARVTITGAAAASPFSVISAN
jgi:hypothetical protein